MTTNQDTPIRYPNVEVELIGHDGNAFAILGAVKRQLKNAGVSPEEVAEYFADAMSGDYDHLLAVTMSWVTVS